MCGRNDQQMVKMSCNGITITVYFVTWSTNKGISFMNFKNILFFLCVASLVVSSHVYAVDPSICDFLV